MADYGLGLVMEGGDLPVLAQQNRSDVDYLLDPLARGHAEMLVAARGELCWFCRFSIGNEAFGETSRGAVFVRQIRKVQAVRT